MERTYSRVITVTPGMSRSLSSEVGIVSCQMSVRESLAVAGCSYRDILTLSDVIAGLLQHCWRHYRAVTKLSHDITEAVQTCPMPLQRFCKAVMTGDDTEAQAEHFL